MLVFLLAFSITIFQMAKTVSKQLIRRYTHDYVTLLQKEMVSSIELLADQINMFAVRMLTNNDIYALFNDTSLSQREKEARLRKLMDSSLVYRDIIGGLFIVLDTGEIYKYHNEGVIIEEPKISQIKQISESKVPVWGGIVSDQYGDTYILSGRRYKNFYTGQQLGALILCIYEEALSDICQEIQEGWSSSFILNEKGHIISHFEKDRIGKTITEDDFVFLEVESNYQLKSTSNREYIVAVQSLGKRLSSIGIDWRVVSNVPEEYLSRIVGSVNKYIILIQLLSIFAIVLLTIYISNVITKPIIRFQRRVESYFGEKMDVGNLLSPRDEIWFLEVSFRDMAMRINQLIEHNNREKEKQKEMELIALQAQINPHFIYNTLDAIGWMAKKKKQKDIERMIMALSSFFRISLHRGVQFILVRDEIELIKSYVTIEKMRFPNRFNIEYDIPEEMEKYMMLKFVLQPLVENAIKHGISEKRSTGNIRITGTISEGDLLFEVFDDGVGFDPDNMDFKENSNNNYKSGYGLKNVNERIKLEYGEEYGIKIWSRKGEGTKAYVRLKAR